MERRRTDGSAARPAATNGRAEIKLANNQEDIDDASLKVIPCDILKKIDNKIDDIESSCDRLKKINNYRLIKKSIAALATMLFYLYYNSKNEFRFYLRQFLSPILLYFFEPSFD